MNFTQNINNFSINSQSLILASTSPMSNGHNGFPMATPIAFRTSGKFQWSGRDVPPIYIFCKIITPK